MQAEPAPEGRARDELAAAHARRAAAGLSRNQAYAAGIYREIGKRPRGTKGAKHAERRPRNDPNLPTHAELAQARRDAKIVVGLAASRRGRARMVAHACVRCLYRRSHTRIMWEHGSAVCVPPQVPSVAAIKSSGGMATFQLSSPSLEVRGRRSNPSPPLSRFSRCRERAPLPARRPLHPSADGACVRTLLAGATPTAGGPAAAPRARDRRPLACRAHALRSGHAPRRGAGQVALGR